MLCCSLSYIGFLCYKNKAHTHTVLHVHAQHKVNHSINDFLLASTASCYLRVHARRRYAAAAQMYYFNRTSHLYSYSLKFTLLEKVKLKMNTWHICTVYVWFLYHFRPSDVQISVSLSAKFWCYLRWALPCLSKISSIARYCPARVRVSESGHL